MKLLIVEDNPQMRGMIRDFVGDLAGAVTECSDGYEAVAAYTAGKFTCDDRVLMDLQMPRVGGLEATRQIRAVFPDAHIIIVTQHDDPHWRAAAKEAGAMAYVLKENLFELRQILQSKV
jgi:CheY-like chemotaxis protein